MEEQHINVEGLVRVGELTTRLLRHVDMEPDNREAKASGAVEAYGDIAAWCDTRIAAAGPYDDMRALQELILILGDKIRDVRSKATTGDL